MGRVTPFVGVWIEIFFCSEVCILGAVTPFVGVWIEIRHTKTQKYMREPSLPSWECGLKYDIHDRDL